MTNDHEHGQVHEQVHEHEHGHDSQEHDSNAGDYGSLRFPLFTKPIQRQKWGEKQSHPHTNWGDTFFDVFYVAAAYNLGNLIRLEPSPRGLFYFAGCFWPILMIWNFKTYFDSRYYTKDDLWHRVYDLAVLLTLGAAVLHIRPVDILANSEDNIDMFSFALSATLGLLLSIGRLVEVVIGVEGQPVAKVAAKRDVWAMLLPFFSLLAATVVAGVKYYGTDNDEYDDGSDKDYDKDTGSSSSYGDYNVTSDGYGRYLAAADASKSSASSYDANETDAPISLCVAGGILWNILLVVLVMFLLPGGGRHKEVTVPMNVSFTIHRYGEFVMLMLGETVLSLLIVTPSGTLDYFKAFFAGIVSITLLEYLHFRSQPNRPDAHAMRRSKEAGIAYSFLMQIYCGALVVLGTTYKMILYEFIYEDDSDSDKGRRTLFSALSRMLAGATDSSSDLSTDERRQRIANLFCGSMALVWLCSDIMILVHRGLRDNLGRCRMQRDDNKRTIAIMLVVLRVALIGFIVSLSQYVTEPKFLAATGLIGILCQVILRFIGTATFGDQDEDVVIPEGVDPDSYRAARAWPNTTQGRVQRRKSVQD